jgi:hypothetical protein
MIVAERHRERDRETPEEEKTGRPRWMEDRSGKGGMLRGARAGYGSSSRAASSDGRDWSRWGVCQGEEGVQRGEGL